AATADASADSPAGAMAEASRHRLLQLSRGADKCSEAGRGPFPWHPSLVAHAAAAKPERLDDDGTDRGGGRGLAPETAQPPPLARCTLRRQTPEVGAVCSNWARTDLSGMREATRVPTAIIAPAPQACRYHVKGLGFLQCTFVAPPAHFV